MPDKSRQSYVTGTGHNVWGANGAPASWDSGPLTATLLRSQERIRYENGPKTRWKGCVHARTSFSYPDAYIYGDFSSWGGWTAAYNAAFVGWNYGCNPVPYWADTLPPISINDLSFQAMEAMAPKMTSSNSLTNFLLELGDFKRMFSLWNKHGSLLSNIAGANLNYQFGWKPFISDLKRMLRDMLSFEDKLKKLVSSAGSRQYRRYSTSYSVDDVISYGVGAWGGTPLEIKRVTTFGPIKYCACVDYLYTLPNYTYNELYIRGLLDTLGLNMNISQIWEAIPFSFLVDWFVNVGEVLSNLDQSYVDPNITIFGYLNSFKYECTQTSMVRYGSPATPTDYVPWGKFRVHRYHRFRTAPCLTKEIDGSLEFFTDLRKLGLAASLWFK